MLVTSCTKNAKSRHRVFPVKNMFAIPCNSNPKLQQNSRRMRRYSSESSVELVSDSSRSLLCQQDTDEVVVAALVNVVPEMVISSPATSTSKTLVVVSSSQPASSNSSAQNCQERKSKQSVERISTSIVRVNKIAAPRNPAPFVPSKVESFSWMAGEKLVMFRTLGQMNTKTKLIVGKKLLRVAAPRTRLALADAPSRVRRYDAEAEVEAVQETLVFVGSSHAFRAIMREQQKEERSPEQPTLQLRDYASIPKSKRPSRSRSCWELPETPRSTSFSKLGEISTGISQRAKIVAYVGIRRVQQCIRRPSFGGRA